LNQLDEWMNKLDACTNKLDEWFNKLDEWLVTNVNYNSGINLNAIAIAGLMYM